MLWRRGVSDPFRPRRRRDRARAWHRRGLSEPANSIFWAAVGAVEPSLFKAFNPWDMIATPESLAGLFSRAEVPNLAVAAVPGQHYLEHPDRFWEIVLGSGYRATVDALAPGQYDRVRSMVLSELRSAGSQPCEPTSSSEDDRPR